MLVSCCTSIVAQDLKKSKKKIKAEAAQAAARGEKYNLEYNREGYGVMHSSGKILVDGIEMLTEVEFNEGYVYVRKNDKDHLMDTAGNFFINEYGEDYQNGIRTFQYGYAIIDAGFIDKMGVEVWLSDKDKTLIVDGIYARWHGKYPYSETAEGKTIKSAMFDKDVRKMFNLGRRLFIDDKNIYDERWNLQEIGSEWLKTQINVVRSVKPFKNGFAILYKYNEGFIIIDTLFNVIAPKSPTDFQVVSPNVLTSGKDYYSLDGQLLTTEDLKALVPKIPPIPIKVRLIAGSNKIKYKGDGVYQISKGDASEILVDSTGTDIGITIGKIGGQYGYISQVHEFKNGYAIFRTGNDAPLTEKEIKEQERAERKLAKEKQRDAEIVAREKADKAAADAKMMDEILYGPVCKSCEGSGKVETTQQIEHVNSFGRTEKTTYSRNETFGRCPTCNGSGRIK